MTTVDEDEISELAVALEAIEVDELLPPCQLNIDMLKSVAM